MTLDHISARINKGATMTSCHIRAIMINVMWYGEHIWDVSEQQRVNFSYLVTTTRHCTLLDTPGPNFRNREMEIVFLELFIQDEHFFCYHFSVTCRLGETHRRILDTAVGNFRN